MSTNKLIEGRVTGSVSGPATLHPDGTIEIHPSLPQGRKKTGTCPNCGGDTWDGNEYDSIHCQNQWEFLTGGSR